jgi:hypothetical protein
MERNNKDVLLSETQKSVLQPNTLRRPYHAPRLTKLGALAVDTSGSPIFNFDHYDLTQYKSL